MRKQLFNLILCCYIGIVIWAIASKQRQNDIHSSSRPKTEAISGAPGFRDPAATNNKLAELDQTLKEAYQSAQREQLDLDQQNNDDLNYPNEILRGLINGLPTALILLLLETLCASDKTTKHNSIRILQFGPLRYESTVSYPERDVALQSKLRKGS